MKAPVVGVLLSCISAAIGGIVEKRASGGYVQNVSGTASFTMYSGCNSPGKYSISSPDFSLSLNPCINNSMLYIYVYIIGFFFSLWGCRFWVHSSLKPALLWFRSWSRSWRCVWSVLCGNCKRRSLFPFFHWSI